MNTPIPIDDLNGSPVVESRHIARTLDIEHETLMRTIDKYQSVIESKFGLIAFSDLKSGNTKGGRPLKVAYLTEDQAIFVATLSRNSEKVVEFKVLLVQAFQAVRRQQQDLPSKILTPAEMFLQQAQMMVQHEQRISTIESKLDQVLSIQQEAARALLELPRSELLPPEQTTRSKLIELVNNYCRSKHVSQQDIWRRIYDRLFYLYRISIRAYARKNGESLLDVAERNGFIDKIFAIASAEFYYKEN